MTLSACHALRPPPVTAPYATDDRLDMPRPFADGRHAFFQRDGTIWQVEFAALMCPDDSIPGEWASCLTE